MTEPTEEPSERYFSKAKPIAEATQKQVSTQNLQQNATPHQEAVAERRQKLIDGILQGKTIVQLAEELHCDRATLYRDFDEWIQTEEAQYLHKEWLTLYQQLKTENPEKAFDGLTKLLAMIQRKAPEVNLNVTQQQTTTVQLPDGAAAEYTAEQREQLLVTWRIITTQTQNSTGQPNRLH